MAILYFLEWGREQDPPIASDAIADFIPRQDENVVISKDGKDTHWKVIDVEYRFNNYGLELPASQEEVRILLEEVRVIVTSVEP